ncbi:MAG: signal peptide peptidase SppA [Pseudomonadota bacterium]|nr:signal peptide peptidase SppA [Pseudomonadota bacterium]
MSLEYELYEERRRKTRRSSFLWGALISGGLVLAAMLFLNVDSMSYPHIAVFQINGEIQDDPERDSLLQDIAEDENVRALLLRINSPGGSVVGSEALYESIRNISEKKPVISLIGGIGASGAYIAALGSDHIYARGNSLVGSIGVMVQYPDVSKLAHRLGITVDVVSSGDAKVGPHPLIPMDEGSRKFQEALIEDSFSWFKGLISNRRGISDEVLSKVSKGQLFTGRMAVDLDLVDGIGGQSDALVKLGLDDEAFSNLVVREWVAEDHSSLPWFSIFGLSKPGSILNSLRSYYGPMLFSIAS